MSLEDNNKSNSFFSVFNSGNGGGGGGGEVNTASNLGVGLGTYKQKVLADLQFRSLLQSKGITLNYSISDDEIEIAQEVGIVGIGDGTGFYTFYTDINSALASAVAGQSIKLFADIVETNSVSIVLKNNVDIDLNGFTYTLDVSDETDMIVDTNEPVNVTIRNGNLIRLNAVPTKDGDGVAIRITRSASQINLDSNVYVENVGNIVLSMERSGTLVGGTLVGGSATYSKSATTNGRVTNTIFNVTQPVLNGATSVNCIFYTTSGASLYNVISAYGCTIISTTQNYNQGTMFDCVIKSNSTSSALYNEGGSVYNSEIYGQINPVNISDAVIVCDKGATLFNSTIFSSVGKCVILNDAEMSNCSCISLNNCFGVVQLEDGAYLSNNSIKNASTLPNSNAIDIRSISGVVIVGNQLQITNTISYGIDSTIPVVSAYIVSNTLYRGTLVNTTNVTNAQINTPDLYGNILIG